MEQKKGMNVTVVAKDGVAKILTGNDYRELESMSVSTFRTNDIYSFIEYVNDVDNKSIIYYNNEKVIAYQDVKLTRETVPLAVCELRHSKLMNMLMNFSGVYSLDEIEIALMPFRKTMDMNAKKILDVCKNLNVTKVTEIKRTKDNAGNFKFNVKTESGKEYWNPEETFTLKCPVFDHIPDMIEMEYEFAVTYKTTPDGVQVVLNVNKYDTIDVVETKEKEIISNVLSGFVAKFYGSLAINHFDNSWKYLESQQVTINK